MPSWSPLFDDGYINSFFTDYFPRMPHELIIHILSLLEVREILQLQCLIKDKHIRSIPFRQIKKKGLHISVPDEWTVDEFSDLADKLSSIHEAIQTNDDNKYNIIPISISIPFFRSTSINIVDNLLQYPDNYDIELKISQIDLRFQKPLLKLDFINNVSHLSISDWNEYSASDQAKLKLDYSAFFNLRKFRLSTQSRSPRVNFWAWYDTLVSLDLRGVNVGHEFLKFKNLEDLIISMTPGQNTYIKYMPRSLKKLKIFAISDRSGKCIISSFRDWPSNLQSLSINDMYMSEEQSIFKELENFKLPSKLITLKIKGKPLYKILQQLPNTLEDLYIEFETEKTYGPISENIIFPSGMKDITLKGVDLMMQEAKCMKLPSKLVNFTLNALRNSCPLNDYNFELLNSTLESLVIDRYDSSTPFTKLDFSQFSVLTYIRLGQCQIVSLDNFIPPCCLEKLDISYNPITSIDENCALFNNPNKYSKLNDLRITECEINYISPRIKLPINLELFQIADNVEKEFYLNSSFKNHQALEVVSIAMVSKIDIYEGEDNVEQRDPVVVNRRSEWRSIEFEMKWDPIYDDEDEAILHDLCAKVNSYLSIDEEEDVVQIIAL
ncbi:hypothetical protein DFJ63DRAFT_313258 [Scheffersomyces coipomensis]|uniref:uncharacterized protein n=1 Tax=Scheffersomyces coipomensis TaxID=1788519 RepID=UPI00315CB45F